MPVESLDGGKKLRLVHPKGATLELLLYGATILSWKSAVPGVDVTAPIEHLFVSSKAALDGSKPVRGGIPVVFPCFGPPTREEHKHLPQHGYARISTWAWDGNTVLDNDTAVSIRLSDPLMNSTVLTQDQVALAYVVTLAEHQLSTDLHVTNTSTAGSAPLTFQALLHTYFRAPAKSLHVDGLKGLYYTDKTLGSIPPPRSIEQRAVADVQQITDSVYENGPREYTVTWPAGGIKVKAIGFKDVVLWNPGATAGSKIADMEEGGWERYVCLEPGYVSEFKQIQPGESWIGGQVLTPIKPAGLSFS
ncbi:galactose mutarotase-like protein [Phellopilus nigrolimitatus]|nr:galactose mutarotase-like protein [Phellopilus nigrolimitatus]